MGALAVRSWLARWASRGTDDFGVARSAVERRDDWAYSCAPASSRAAPRATAGSCFRVMLCIGGLNEVVPGEARIVPMPSVGRNRPDKRCEGQCFRQSPKTY